jgi:formate-dependent nitrite reductase membrane component NrfD
VLTVIGTLLGLYLAGYTGVLLAVTNRPIWADTTLLGLTFVISAGSTSAALLLVLGAASGISGEGMLALERFDGRVLVLELVAIVALIVSLGRVAIVWANAWGLLLALMVLGGIALPLILRWRPPALAARWLVAPVLVLAGGLMLRAVIVLSSGRL